MEAALISFFTQLVASGSITVSGLIVIVIVMLIGITYYLLTPIHKTVKGTPSLDDVRELINSQGNVDAAHVESINKTLDEIIKKLEEIDSYDRDNYRELKELRRDVESVKQILNQFHGHMLYGRTPSDFGNKELK